MKDCVTEKIIEETNEETKLDGLLRKMKRMNSPGYLHTVSLNELYENVYESRPPVIDGLLYAGAYILAGAPKIGKSFLVAQLAYHVSTGQPLWGYDVHQGTVLYLALEDDFRRLQDRMSRMFGVEGTDELYFSVDAKMLGDGLDRQLEQFVREHPDTKLIVLETLQKVREASKDYSYGSDYELMNRLKCFADGALLMRKEKRTDLTATLDAAGRDQPDQRLHLKKNSDSLTWELECADTQPWRQPPDPVLEAVAKLSISAGEWEGSPSELAGR